MEFFIAEEGIPINLGPDGGSIAYFGSEIDFQYETEAPHGDGIFSSKASATGKNASFLDLWAESPVFRCLLFTGGDGGKRQLEPYLQYAD